jgi:hypothetical protein
MAEHATVHAVYDVSTDGDGKVTGPMQKLDTLLLWPHSGYGENVRVRLWPLEGQPFDAADLRGALDDVAPVRSLSETEESTDGNG